MNPTFGGTRDLEFAEQRWLLLERQTVEWAMIENVHMKTK